jgi:cob(I)alamin adenosyltransferase
VLHIYTGNGKGKTTAAFGLALRAAGRGKTVVIVQFLKGRETGEIVSLAHIPNISVYRNEKDYGFFPSAAPDRRALMTCENNRNLRTALESAWDMLILDEAAAAYRLEAVDRQLVDRLVETLKVEQELVLTGREPPEHWLNRADYVSEICCVKHPFEKGVAAREGIEF